MENITTVGHDDEDIDRPPTFTHINDSDDEVDESRDS